MPVPEVIVIGAGPAGCIAAIRLAQLGRRVALIERSRFPRDKVCGECLSSLGIDVLTRLGLSQSLSVLGPAELRRSTTVAPDGTSATIALPRPMWGLTRAAMDQTLLGVARRAGVDVRQPCEVTAVTAAKGGRGSSCAAAVRGAEQPMMHARYVLIADGRSALLGDRPPPTGDFGIKAHFVGVDAPRDAIELVGFGRGRGYGGLAPVEGDRFNAAWSVPESTLRTFAGDLEALFQAHVNASAWLRRRFASARRVGEWLACPLPRFAVRKRWPANVIPAGNAAAALEPVGGEGMGLAMRSAELAAEAIDAALRADVPVDTTALRRAYRRLWDVRRAACRASAILLSDERSAPLAIEMTRAMPAVVRAGLYLVGKR